jgi:hypothetical protein
LELTGHERQAVSAVAAGVVEYFPVTQGVHEAEPIPTLYVPAAHVEHMPSCPVYPALHGGKIQAALDVLVAGEFVPAGQPTHVSTAVAASVDEYVPVSQLVHAAEPVAVLYFPAEQGVHVLPAGPVYPASHTQSKIDPDVPSVLEYNGHRLQFALPSDDH